MQTVDSDSIDAMGGQGLANPSQVGSGEAEGASAALSLDDSARQRVGAGQNGVNTVEIAFHHCLAGTGAREAAVIVTEQRCCLRLEPELPSESLERLEVAAAAGAKAEVFADSYASGAQALDEHAANESLGCLRGESCIEVFDDDTQGGGRCVR